jgi:hypothetical protein
VGAGHKPALLFGYGTKIGNISRYLNAAFLLYSRAQTLLLVCTHMQPPSPRVLGIDYMTVYLGWTNTPWPQSAVYDFSVWRLKAPVTGYGPYMTPLNSDSYVSKTI